MASRVEAPREDNGGDVLLDGIDAATDRRSDLRIVPPFGDEASYLLSPRRQLREASSACRERLEPRTGHATWPRDRECYADAMREADNPQH